MEITADVAAVQGALEAFILSASGWRKVFAADGDEESSSPQIAPADMALCFIAAECFARFVKAKCGKVAPAIVLGRDTRPTGGAIAQCMAAAFAQEGVNLIFVGIAAAPEIMAYARGKDAFAYVSASHNPIGHNGLKFGLSDGGVLSSSNAALLIEDFKNAACSIERIEAAKMRLAAAELAIKTRQESKAEMLAAYEDFARTVITGFGRRTQEDAAKQARIFAYIKEETCRRAQMGNAPAVFADFNGGARCLSIDKSFIEGAGINLFCMNDEPGKIAHGIIPEGENLLPAALAMQALREAGRVAPTSPFIGYVPDCDGDRGNIIFYNEKTGRMETPAAQEVFALAVIAELGYMEYAGLNEGGEVAVVVNDPTSMRIERIAAAFGATVARAEVGEANVVNLARRLAAEGKRVRILGEGSNGGNITWPSAVRDPLATVFALVKLLLLKSSGERRGIFHIWLEKLGLGNQYKEDFTLADVIATIPAFTTTPVSAGEAKINIRARDHAELKRAFQRIFLKEWQEKKDGLYANFGIADWVAVRNNGIEEAEGIADFGESGKGGLKVIFLDEKREKRAFFWMRGSGTEPVFRVLADAEGANNPLERELLCWLKAMLAEADSLICRPLETESKMR